MMRVDYVRVPGRTWIEDPDHRFDTLEIRAPLVFAARRAINTVHDELLVSFALPEKSLTRADETMLPLRVVREAVVNALMHRSYRIQGPIQILRYANRLEIRNPGHSLKAEEQLGEPGSETRNPRIAAVLHDVRMAETKGSGIRAMRELMLRHELLPPTFESSRRPDQFVATLLFHHFLGEADVAWLGSISDQPLSDEESRALVFVREVGAIDNAAYRNLNRTDTLNASGHLRRLRDLGLLEMRGSGNRTYYLPGPGLGANLGEATADPHQLAADPHQLAADPHQLAADPHQLVDPLPPPLRKRLAESGRRPRQQSLRALIVDLCAFRPFAARELAQLLGDREPKELVRTHLGPMVAAGVLAYTIPQMPNHPDQRYRCPDEPGAEGEVTPR